MTVVSEIRAAIVRMGWSETARRSGVDRTVLHRTFAEKPRKGPSLRTIERVLPALGLELAVRERGQ